MESPDTTRADAENHVTNLQLINARPKQESPLLALNEKIGSYLQCDPDALDAAGFAFASSMILGTYQRDEKDHRLDIPVTYGFPVLSRVIGTDPSCMDEDRSPGITKLAPVLIALLVCPDDAETMRRVADDQLKNEYSFNCPQETPSESFSSVYRTAKAAALGAGQTTVLEVTHYESDSLERPNPNNEAKCGRDADEKAKEKEVVVVVEDEDDNEGEEAVKEEGDNERQPREHQPRFMHLLNIGIGPEGAIIWSGDLSKARLRSWDEADKYAAGFDQLVDYSGAWTDYIDGMYNKLFLVDINHFPGPYPECKQWLRVRVFENVTYENLVKFRLVEG
ncbi:DNA polymerase zeta catalytic [Apiospora sp. TS-2023a]